MIARLQVFDSNNGVRILEDIVPERCWIGGRIVLSNAVQVENVVFQLDGVAGQTDDAFHQAGAINRRIEYDDVTANWIAPRGQMHSRERDLQVVGEFVYQNQFALEDRWFHRTGRHPVPVRDGRLEWGSDKGHQNEGTQPFAPDFVGNEFHKIWAPLRLRTSN